MRPIPTPPFPLRRRLARPECLRSSFSRWKYALPPISTALEAAVGQHADALIVIEDPLTTGHQAKIAEFAIRKRLPMMAGFKMFADAGGLISYGPNPSDFVRESVGYVAKILKGAKPSDLPVEQPTRFELVVNLKTAKTLGLTIPPSVLGLADEVIE